MKINKNIKKTVIAVILLAIIAINQGMSRFEATSNPDYIDLNINGIMDAYENPKLDPHKRAVDLVARLTLKEKASLMASNAAAVPRLGIPEFGWDNEGKHAIVSCFPTSIGLAATWNPALTGSVAEALSDEARIMSRKDVAGGNRLKWLSFWAPTINMARDPRWGRTMEAYGEDPCLQSEMAVAFVKALQGDDPKYLKAVAGVNHYAVYNRELGRHELDAVVEDEKMLREYYLHSFEKCVTQAKNAGIGATNNAVNGTPACVNDWLLTHVLREEWGFDGYVFSDAGSLSDVAGIRQHVKNQEEAMALAIHAGLDIDCGRSFETWLEKSVLDGLANENQVDESLIRSFTVRFRLGMFDPPHINPYNAIPDSLLDGAKHRKLARQAATEAIVLLKNKNKLLPLNQSKQKIVLAGPLADQPELGRKQQGKSSKNVSLLEGLKNRFGAVNVSYSKNIEQSLEQARQADVIIYSTSVMEGEVADQFFLRLSDRQEKDILQLAKTGKPLIVVLNSGSMVDVSPWIEKADAILAAWYPGEEGGNAIADVLSGDVNPSGKLPLTYYSLGKPLPPFDDFDISKGRTYQYLDQKPLFPFGFGLSYTDYKIGMLNFKQTGKTIRLAASVTNKGQREGAEVVQLYVSYKGDGSRVFPKKQLKKFSKVSLKPGEEKQVEFVLTPEDITFYDNQLNYKAFKGEYEITIGNSSENNAAKRTFRINREIVFKTGPKLTYADLELPNHPLQPGVPFTIRFVCQNRGEVTGKPEILLDGKPVILKDQFVGPGKSNKITANIEVYGSGAHILQLPGQKPVQFVISEAAADFVVSPVNFPQLGSIESRDTFEYNVFNKGGISGWATIEFQINGETQSQGKVELKPGENRKIQFTHIFREPGAYSIATKGNDPLSFLVGAPVKAPYKVFSNSEGQSFQIGENSFWAEYKGAVGGTPVHNNYGGRTSLDRYGVVYIPGGMTENAVATVRIHRMSLEVSNYSKVGIMVRNKIDQPEKSSGYCVANIHAYYGGGGLFEWDSENDGYLDAIERFSVSSFPNKWIRLEKHNQTFIVWSSPDGLKWKKQLEKEIPGAASVQDVGVFVVSDHPDEPCKAIFSDFKIVPLKEKLQETDTSEPEQNVKPFTTEPL